MKDDSNRTVTVFYRREFLPPEDLLPCVVESCKEERLAVGQDFIYSVGNMYRSSRDDKWGGDCPTPECEGPLLALHDRWISEIPLSVNATMDLELPQTCQQCKQAPAEQSYHTFGSAFGATVLIDIIILAFDVCWHDKDV